MWKRSFVQSEPWHLELVSFFCPVFKILIFLFIPIYSITYYSYFPFQWFLTVKIYLRCSIRLMKSYAVALTTMCITQRTETQMLLMYGWVHSETDFSKPGYPNRVQSSVLSLCQLIYWFYIHARVFSLKNFFDRRRPLC